MKLFFLKCMPVLACVGSVACFLFVPGAQAASTTSRAALFRVIRSEIDKASLQVVGEVLDPVGNNQRILYLVVQNTIKDIPGLKEPLVAGDEENRLYSASSNSDVATILTQEFARSNGIK